MDTPLLWHIPLSHYSEKVRWALDYKGIAHRRRVLGPDYLIRVWRTTGRARTALHPKRPPNSSGWVSARRSAGCGGGGRQRRAFNQFRQPGSAGGDAPRIFMGPKSERDRQLVKPRSKDFWD